MRSKPDFDVDVVAAGLSGDLSVVGELRQAAVTFDRTTRHAAAAHELPEPNSYRRTPQRFPIMLKAAAERAREEAKPRGVGARIGAVGAIGALSFIKRQLDAARPVIGAEAGAAAHAALKLGIDDAAQTGGEASVAAVAIVVALHGATRAVAVRTPRHPVFRARVRDITPTVEVVAVNRRVRAV